MNLRGAFHREREEMVQRTKNRCVAPGKVRCTGKEERI